MSIFKIKAKPSARMFTSITLGLGVVLTIVGLILALKNVDPKYFNVIAGSIIASLTLIGLFGKLLQDLSSSETQQEMRRNIERSLQPFVLSSFQVAIRVDLDNPVIDKFKKNTAKIKKQLEEAYAKTPPAVNGERLMPSIPGVDTFQDQDDIINYMSIDNQDILKNSEVIFPIVKLEFSKQYPKEFKQDTGHGTYSYTTEFPVSYAVQTLTQPEQNLLTSAIIEYNTNAVTFFIMPTRWQDQLDNGEIVSFKDLFEQVLRVSIFYPHAEFNAKKIEGVSITIMNERKKLFILFTKDEKSKSPVDLNVSYVHKISESDFVR